MPVAMPPSRVFLSFLATVVVAAIVVVAGSRSSWSDVPPHPLSVRNPEVQDVEAKPQKQRAPEEHPPKDGPVPAAPTGDSATEAAPTKEAVPADDAAPQEKTEASVPPSVGEDDPAGRDPIRQLSRRYARRRPDKDRVAHAPPPPASEIHKPILELSKDHRETCLVFQGDAIPTGTLVDDKGQDHALRESLGKRLTVIVFWSVNNPYSLDQFQEMQHDIVPLCDQGVQAIAIHVGPPPQDYAQLCSDNGTGMLCLLDADQKYFAQWASRKLPRTYLLNAEGKILWLDLEYSRATRYDLRNALHFFLQQ